MLFYKKVMIDKFERLASLFVGHTLCLAHRIEYDCRGTRPDVSRYLINVDVATGKSINQRKRKTLNPDVLGERRDIPLKIGSQQPVLLYAVSADLRRRRTGCPQMGFVRHACGFRLCEFRGHDTCAP